MAKQKEQKQSDALTLAKSQKVGYLPKDEYDIFKELLAKTGIKGVETKLGNILRIVLAGKKFYTEA